MMIDTLIETKKHQSTSVMKLLYDKNSINYKIWKKLGYDNQYAHDQFENKFYPNIIILNCTVSIKKTQ
jgi:hypothetical protein